MRWIPIPLLGGLNMKRRTTYVDDTPDAFEYPSSDGKPMADNTTQYRWMTKIVAGLKAEYVDDPNIFVAGDLLWYPVRGSTKIRIAPDVLVALGRPRGDRRSYRQWVEDNVPPHVVMEILSDCNTEAEMAGKLQFYDEYGVSEYYVYDPDLAELRIYLREGTSLTRVPFDNKWTSPLLGIHFEMRPKEADIRIYGRDGTEFREVEQLVLDRNQAVKERKRLARDRKKVILERDKLAAKLRELGIDPDSIK